MNEQKLTRCPGCATVFRVTAAQLALREGQVRCGHCRAVFDANDHVVTLDIVEPENFGVEDELLRGRPTVTLRSADALLPVAPDAPIKPAAERSATGEPQREPNEKPGPDEAPTGEGAAETAPVGAPAVEEAADGGATAVGPAAERSTDGGSAAVEQAPDKGALTREPAGDGFAAEGAGERATVEDPVGERDTRKPTDVAGKGTADGSAGEDTAAEGTADEAAGVGTGGDGATPSATDAAAADAHVAPPPADTAPIDLRDADSPQRFEWNKRAPADAPRRGRYAAGIVVLSLAIIVQLVAEFRDALAARVPATRPLLSGVCRALSCRIEPLKDTAALSIDASDLQADPAHRGLLILSATIRNRAAHPIAYPHLELTLTDSSERIVVRRAFAPQDYAGGTADFQQGILANGERLVKLFIDASATQQAGYQLYLFYP